MKRLVAIATVFVVFVSLGMVASAEAQSLAQNETAPSRANRGDDVPTIFDVRKSLPMEPTDPTYHDFYINAGIESGFKKGQYLPVQRAIPVHDPVQNKQQAILTVPVGKVQVIHVEHGLTVARMVTELGDDERPTLEFEAIMIGDRVDMKGITMDAPKEVGKKKKRAAVAPAPPTVLEAATAAVVEIVTPSVSEAAAVAPATANPPTPTASQPVKTDAGSQPSSPPRVTQTVPPPTA